MSLKESQHENLHEKSDDDLGNADVSHSEDGSLMLSEKASFVSNIEDLPEELRDGRHVLYLSDGSEVTDDPFRVLEHYIYFEGQTSSLVEVMVYYRNGAAKGPTCLAD